MSDSSNVHWEEGLFLQPHHLQVMQHRMTGALHAYYQLTRPYPFGLIRAVLSQGSLAKGEVRFEELKLVMPGGLLIDVPGNTDLPAREFTRAFAPGAKEMMIGIGVPRWNHAVANCVETNGDGAKRLYRVSESELLDENTGRNPQSVRVRRLNARLILGNEDTSDLDVMPLMRVKSAAATTTGQPAEDDGYFPPCLVLDGWARLYGLCFELSKMVGATRDRIAKDLAHNRFDFKNIKSVEISSLLRLMVLNRYAGRLAELVRAPGISPFEFYLELRSLLAELSIADPGDMAAHSGEYDPYELAVLFKDLYSRIEPYLREDPKRKPAAIRFVRQVADFVAPPLSADLANAPEHYLVITAPTMNSNFLAEVVHRNNEIKLMPTRRKETAVPGVTLRFEHQAPPVVPSGVGVNAFRVTLTDPYDQELWALTREQGMTLTWRRVGTDASEVTDVTLYVLKAEGSQS